MKINWTLLICLIALMIFWVFAVWVIGNIIVLQERAEMYNNEEQYLDILRQRRKELNIAMFKETYHCPDPDKENICKRIAELSDKHNVDKQLMIDLAYCESRLIPHIIGRIDKDDLGLYQINSRFHDVSDECRKDIKCSTIWTINKVKQGQIHLWNCYELIR